MSAGHTPGPWSAEFVEFGDTVTDRVCIVGPSPNFRDIATIDQCFQGVRNKAMEQANASLIAAAPDLLAALQTLDDACCADLEDRENSRENRINFRKALISGRAAISKALGESA